ncbi:MAG: TniB family NTP-binding protein [Pseudomonadota bacterium]|nr:TniB family NTP-binding protein [Pseudomonadota bacterium]MEE3320500.1 TniB family NTP-binding protein [Pseudomonadota bacterium]
MSKMNFEAINTLSSRRIKHPVYTGCLSLLEELYQHAAFQAEKPQSNTRGAAYLFTAETGVGKTTLLTDFLDAHPAYMAETDMGQQWTVPVALIRVPPACTLKGYIYEICRVLKVATTRENTTSLLTRKAIDGLKNAGTCMFITDETNIVLESASQKEIIHIRNFIKQLIDEAGIPIVFFGLPADCNEFFNSDRQTVSRLLKSRNLPEFSPPNGDDSMMHKTAMRYLKHLADDCKIGVDDDMKPLEFSQRLYLASRGMMREISQIITESAKYAMRKGKTALGQSDFQAICSSLNLNADYDPFGADRKALQALMAKMVSEKKAGLS